MNEEEFHNFRAIAENGVALGNLCVPLNDDGNGPPRVVRDQYGTTWLLEHNRAFINPPQYRRARCAEAQLEPPR